MSKFKVNDEVRVIDWGKAYTTNYNWFEQHKCDIPFRYAVRYAYANSANYINQIEKSDVDEKAYKVLFVEDDMLLITPVESYFEGWRVVTSQNSPIFLISEYGVKKYLKKKMTKKQIEAELGYFVEIVEE